jgi:transglutaminase-like putative cysteine protease
MTVLTVRHKTTYRYRRPVRFGEHRLMFRPRDSHDLRLIDTRLSISPAAEVRWVHDVFSNSIAIATFKDAAQELVFDSRFTIQNYPLENAVFPVDDFARSYPFSYSRDEIPDLGRTIERHCPDPEHKVDAWAKAFVQGGDGAGETNYILGEITRAIYRDFAYERRYDVGTRDPVETLNLGSGSCREYALFMMEAVRSLGLAARFVTGYLYDPSLDGAAGGLQGAGDTHAWVQVYLPGAGWVEFDPTNGLVGGGNLIRVAVARDPSQAIPLQGRYYGDAGDFIDMEVEVRVSAGAPAP